MSTKQNIFIKKRQFSIFKNNANFIYFQISFLILIKYLEKHFDHMTNSCNKAKKMSTDYFNIKGKPNLYISGEVNVKFTPLRKRKGLASRSIVPTFNHDRKCYTIAFKMPSVDMDSQEDLLLNHKQRLIAAQKQISEMLYPKPSSTHCYCAVCRLRYEDYKTHVQSDEHHERIRSSVFQRFIVETALMMRQEANDKKEEDSKTTDNSLSEEKLFECLTFDLINDGGVLQ